MSASAIESINEQQARIQESLALMTAQIEVIDNERKSLRAVLRRIVDEYNRSRSTASITVHAIERAQKIVGGGA